MELVDKISNRIGTFKSNEDIIYVINYKFE